MREPPRQDWDMVSTGWLRVLPEPAFEALGMMIMLRQEPIAGDLDELDADDVLHMQRFGGLDAPFDPRGRLKDGDDDPQWVGRWDDLGAQARKHGMAMRTPRDAILFMEHIRLVERADHDGAIYWRSASPDPADRGCARSQHRRTRTRGLAPLARGLPTFRGPDHRLAPRPAFR